MSNRSFFESAFLAALPDVVRRGAASDMTTWSEAHLELVSKRMARMAFLIAEEACRLDLERDGAIKASKPDPIPFTQALDRVISDLKVI